MSDVPSWWLYRGDGRPSSDARPWTLPPPPPWRRFTPREREARGEHFQVEARELEVINAALYLRRPLLVTGEPGTGKSTLAYAVAHELGLGEVLRWSITTRSTLQSALYEYDAIGRLEAASLRRAHQDHLPVPDDDDGADIGNFIRLGPLGTALLPGARPRVLLIDEIDKSDVDLPNDLLHVFEEGEFEIRELRRRTGRSRGATIDAAEDGLDWNEPRTVAVHTYDGGTADVVDGRVRCTEFPFVVLTTNGERSFPPAFRRRCLPLTLDPPSPEKLARIVAARLGEAEAASRLARDLIERFQEARQDERELATDQLLNAIYLALSPGDPLERSSADLLEALWKTLGESD